MSSTPRAVLVTRETDFERLLAAHATRGQAEFFLRSRNQKLETLEATHHAIKKSVVAVRQQLPDSWRVAYVQRKDLDRFLFAPDDYIFAVGQDGLVANLAKYLDGQIVFGINPVPNMFEGTLVQISVESVADHLSSALRGRAKIEMRTMLEARIEGGPNLFALNEVFVGHRSHQSARYEITFQEKREAQSSSGIIIATGTGATGWAKSIMTATYKNITVPPQDRRALFFAREPWPSKTTGADLAFGIVEPGNNMSILSNMNDGGVIFADGIEEDCLEFGWGKRLTVAIAAKTLNLVGK